MDDGPVGTEGWRIFTRTGDPIPLWEIVLLAAVAGTAILWLASLLLGTFWKAAASVRWLFFWAFLWSVASFGGIVEFATLLNRIFS